MTEQTKGKGVDTVSSAAATALDLENPAHQALSLDDDWGGFTVSDDDHDKQKVAYIL